MSEWNRIVSVRVGPTEHSVLARTDGVAELLTSRAVIFPAYLQDTSFREFDISGITTAADGSYWVFIQVGRWEYFCPDGLNCSWTINPGNWECCNGEFGCYKWGAGICIQPYDHPEVIRATEYLPHVGFAGTDFCN